MAIYTGKSVIGNPMLLPTNPIYAGIDLNSGSTKFSDTQLTILGLSSRVASIMSIASSLTILGTFLLWKRYRTPANRLLTFMAISDLMSSCSTFVGTWSMSVENYSPVCVFQGMLMQWGDLSSIAWTAAMAFNLFMVLFMTRSARDLASLEKFYFFICYGIPFVIAFIPVFISSPDRGLVYGQDVLWCWISDQWDGLRLALFYVPVWVVFLFNFTIYLVSSVRILIRTSNLPAVHPNLRSSVISLAASSRPVSTSNISLDSEATRRAPAYSSATSVISSSQISLSTLETFRSRYFVRIGLFMLAYLLAWLVPSVNRTRGFILGHSEDYQGQYFMWYWAQEILTPLRGCINFLCYYILTVANVLEEKRRDSK